MSQGSNTVQQSSGPPQQFLNAYSNVTGQAQNVASQPYQQYPGSLVANLSPDQLAGISATENIANSNVSAPYLNSAAQYIDQSTQPLFTSDINNYISQSASPAVTQSAQQGAAGVLGATNQGQGQVMGAANMGSMGIMGAGNAGVSNIMNASGEFNPASIQQFVSPYTNQVVNATQQQFNNQNAQQQAQLAGNAASQGAWGGDRSAVAQSLLAGQQQQNEAPVIANLENTGYQTGVQAAETQAGLGLQGATSAGQLGLGAAEGAAQTGLSGASTAAGLGLQGQTTAGQMGMQGATTQAQLESQAASTLLGGNEAQGWLNSQAGYGEANLGNEALTNSLEGANALLGVGGLEQQQAQESLNVPYEEYEAQQAYPFQTTGWLANIDEGLGSASGGTSSTTYPSASVGSELAGAATAGAGILGETGAFGSSGYLSNLFGGESSSCCAMQYGTAGADTLQSLGFLPALSRLSARGRDPASRTGRHGARTDRRS